MATENNRELIPLDQLTVGMKVETQDGRFRAVVESRNGINFALKFSLYDGGDPPNNPVLEFNNNASFKFILATEAE